MYVRFVDVLYEGCFQVYEDPDDYRRIMKTTVHYDTYGEELM